VFCFEQSENTPSSIQQCHIYLLTYYPMGTRVPNMLAGRVPG